MVLDPNQHVNGHDQEPKTCTICGRTIADFAGRFVPTVVVEGDNSYPGEPEFHCFECDPVDLSEPAEPDYGGGN